MNYFLIIILGVLIGTYVLDLIVDTLNVRHVKTDLPEEFRDCYDADKYKKSQEYLRENTRFGIVSDSIMTPITPLSFSADLILSTSLPEASSWGVF